jgi:N6-adenosine-specific RNA methylase IME4
VRYGTIVADPPWRYSATSEAKPQEGRSSRMVEGHYPTMSVEEIAALPVAELAAERSHLYLWVTNPRLYGNNRDSGGKTLTPLDIVEAWGFSYITLLTWVKTGAPGMGFYFRGMTEHVIFAARNKCPIPTDKRESNVFTAPRGRHSEKPDNFMDLVERVSPGPYLEMFSRRARFGWDTWGDESLGTAQIGGLAG